jgi:predicted anti-sigma-YlaC factor YlaD
MQFASPSEGQMTCNETQELITALIDREPHESERALLEVHLRECGDCRSALATEKALKQAIRDSGAQLLAARCRAKSFRIRVSFRPKAISRIYQ